MSNGFDFSEFTDLIKQLEQLGADSKQVAERVLNAGSEPAKQAFINNTPFDETTEESKRTHEHARNSITVSKTKSSKRGSKYRIVGADNEKFKYLFFVENGTIKIPAKPFRDKAYREARAAASEPMEQALIQEINNHLR